jgi:EAL domain-containing protein (putative c-di-GMP-specific phosphodiesterase class I)
VVDLFDEEGMLEEISPDQLVIEVDEKEMMEKDKVKQKTLRKQNKGDKKVTALRTEEEEE